MNEFLNVRENAVLYDAILIGGNVPTLFPTAQWYANFQAAALANEWALFNIRNEAMVGAAYCNMDSIDKMTFPFQVSSIGVQFFAMPAAGKTNIDTYGLSDEQREAAGMLIWLQEIAKHTSLILKINQDEKLVVNCTQVPSGYGVEGDIGITAPSAFCAAFSTWGNGDKEISNRFRFPVPLDIPRNQTISCKLELSAIGKQLLAACAGPLSLITKDDEDGAIMDPPSVPTVLSSVCGVRVSLEGHRFVQQRGMLHV